MVRFNDELAAGLGVADAEIDQTGTLHPLGAFAAHAEEAAHPAHIAFAPGGQPLAQPAGFLGDLFVDPAPGRFLVRQHLVRPVGKDGEAFGIAAHFTTVDPVGPVRQSAEEGPVMADQQDAALEGFQFLFQPFDGRQVEMVCRLVQ